MAPSAGQDVLLCLAALGAGFVNGAAGGGTLISFPALLAAGYPALTANVTSTVGIWSGYLGGSAGFWREVNEQRSNLRLVAPTAVAGATVGGVLLLTTPSHDFRELAPYLLLTACLLFALQPLVSRALGKRSAAQRTRASILHVGTFVASVYGAYFGAGLGVVLLAVLGTALSEPLARVNGLRSVVALLVNTVAVVIFMARAHIAWLAAGLMTGCALAGGYVGARVARRAPTALLRAAIVAIGLASALDLLV
jgi:uncharacterized membrane protein YfcA